ncbi:interleukin-1 receptor type 2-like isoform X2 [Alosa pseudoharengus]
MAWSVWVGLLLLLAEDPKGSKGETEEPETDEDYYTSNGYAIALPCGNAEESENVTWRRREDAPLDTAVAGVEVRGGALWFLPADSSHSGIYVCERSDERWDARLHVGSEVCPELNRDVYLMLNHSGHLSCCEQDHIFRYGANLRITWLKDCMPLNRSERILEFPKVSLHDKGNYTCLLHFSLEGHNYTSANTAQVSIDVPKQLSRPQVILPINGTREVELGSRHELRCEVSTGNTETLVFWRMKDSEINNTHFTITEQVLESRVVKTLIISEVRVEHLNIPFRCWATNSLGQDVSQILLHAANQELFNVWMGVGMGVVVAAGVICLLVVLLRRSHCPQQHGSAEGLLLLTQRGPPR